MNQTTHDTPDDPPLADDESDSHCRGAFMIELDEDLPAAPNVNWLKKNLQNILDQLTLQSYQLNFIIINDQRMTDLHDQFMNIPETTDVITFDLTDPDDTPDEESLRNIEGEIYLCIDEAMRQSTARNHDLDTELLLYATHGVLHLLGYDDHDPHDHQLMHEKEDQLLHAIGVGVVYNSDKKDNSK